MKILIAILSILLLTGCGGMDKVFVKPEIVEKPPLLLADPEPIRQLPLEWHVITKQNLEKKLAEIEKENGTVVLFALTAEGYQALSMNAADARRYIRELNKYLEAMKKYYEPKKSNSDENKDDVFEFLPNQLKFKKTPQQ